MHEVTPEQRAEIVSQIGHGVVASISGGRVVALTDGIELPVSNGYRVRVHLTAADDYTVRRIFTRKGQDFIHGERTGIYCDQISETAYRAGMFRSYAAGEW